MQFDTEIQRLESENSYLQAQIRDLEYFMEAREEELILLRAKSLEMARLQSEYQNGLLELEQLNLKLREALQKLASQAGIKEQLEGELLRSVSSERELLDLKEKSASMGIENDYLLGELQEFRICREEVDSLRRKVSLLNSRLNTAIVASELTGTSVPDFPDHD